ncbi:hypothetical protein RLOC_00002723 [Lonchura striata]|uniref:Uncharacterized protein n=1 Tax=Lonchura striata TaxID=40157 RepID=A0A218UV05_9PASE|nr:hypothetical protein RLOC_00002723 [Lonchura striata domestica]
MHYVAPRHDEGQAPLAFSHTLESFLFSIVRSLEPPRAFRQYRCVGPESTNRLQAAQTASPGPSSHTSVHGQEPLSAHLEPSVLTWSYVPAPAMVTAVSQTDIMAGSQPCPVTVDLPGRPGGHRHVAGAVRNHSLDCILTWKMNLGRWA